MYNFFPKGIIIALLKTKKFIVLRYLLFLLCCCATFHINAQTVNGIIYDAETKVKGAKVLNITQKASAITNDNGEFQITAKPKDTLYFESLFHHPQYSIVENDFFKGTYVFELKKIVNELDEVLIKDQPKTKLFKEEAFNENLKEIIALDKDNGTTINNGTPKYGADLVQLVNWIGRLLKKKKKTEIKTLKYNQLKLLWETNNFFNKKMLVNDLLMPEQYHSLFFEFCEAKQIPENSLNYNKRLELLDKFTQYAQEFMIIVEITSQSNKD